MSQPIATRRVRHKARGTTYQVIGVGLVQTKNPLRDMAGVVIYQGEEDGRLWVRPDDEFNDGRFEDIGPANEGGAGE